MPKSNIWLVVTARDAKIIPTSTGSDNLHKSTTALKYSKYYRYINSQGAHYAST